MIFCPYKGHKQWKKMVAELGEPLSYLYFNRNGGDFLTDQEIIAVKETSLKKDNAAVDYSLKLPTLITQKYDQFEKLWKQFKNKDDFFKKLQDNKYGLPKEQVLLLEALYNGQPFNELLIEFIVNYSYTVEINTAKNIKQGYVNEFTANTPDFIGEDFSIEKEELNTPTQYYANLTVPGGTNYTEQEIATPAITPSIKGHAQFATDKGIGWFRSDDKTIDELKGNWIKNESELPNEFIYSGEKYFKENGEWQTKNNFIEDVETVIWRYNMSLGNERIQNKPETKTRRILEVQSDLFQKGRTMEQLDRNPSALSLDTLSTLMSELNSELDNDKISLEDYKIERAKIEEQFKISDKFKNAPANQFLQLLNKDNNWVTFFTKSIIQDSLSKGYEKVLFPSGNTASKVEGHTTLEEFKKQKEDRIKELEKEQNKLDSNLEQGIYGMDTSDYELRSNKISEEIETLEKELERVEREGLGALKPIYNFYENTVTNILKKNYSIKQITDEYGNTWNEISLSPEIQETILLDKESTQGQKQSDIRKNYFEGGDTMKTSVMLDKLSKSSHPLAPLAQHLKQFVVDDAVITLQDSEGMEVPGKDFKAAGLYNSESNTIDIAEFSSFKKSFEATMLHEIMHSLTFKGVRNNNNTALVFERLYNHALKNLEKDKYYELSNLDEFIVGLFTDSSFIKALQEIPAASKIKPYKNLFAEIFDKILNFLKINKKDSLYSQAFSVATNIIQEQFQRDKSFVDSENIYKESMAAPALAKELGLHSKQLSNQQTIIVKRKVELYNKRNGTSYFVKFTQLGESTLYSWEIQDKANGQIKMFDKAEEHFTENELFDTLKEFCDRHGIDIKVIKNLQLQGKDVRGIADILAKIISLSNNANITDFTEEVAHFAIELLGDDNQYVKVLMELIDKHPIYAEILREYGSLYKSEEEFRKEAIGKLLRDAVLSKFKSTQSEGTIKNMLRGLYNNFLRVINKITGNQFYKSELDSIINKIANDVLTNKIENKELTKDLKLASFIESEQQMFEDIQITLKNRYGRLKAKLKNVNGVSKNLQLIKDAEKKKDIKAAVDIFISQVEEDLLDFLKDRNELEPSLVNRWLANRSNFSVTSEMLMEIKLFTNNYSKAIEEFLDYINRYHRHNQISVYDELYTKLNNILKDVKELQSYYEQWERQVLKNILEEDVQQFDAPYTADKLLEELYNTSTNKDSSFWRSFFGSARNSSNDIIRLIATKLAKYLDVVETHRNTKLEEMMVLYKKVREAGLTDSDFIETLDEYTGNKNVSFLISEYTMQIEHAQLLSSIEIAVKLFKKEELNKIFEKEEFTYDQYNLSKLEKNMSDEQKKEYYNKKNEWLKNNYEFADGSELNDLYLESPITYEANANSNLFPIKPKEKYRNPKFADKMKNPVFAEFYNYLLALRKEDINRLPKEYNNYRGLYMLPQISSNHLDVLKNGTGMKDYLKNKFQVIPEDINIYGSEIKIDYFGNEIKSVPINYLYPIDNGSRDLVYLFGSFTEMSKNYEVMGKASDDLSLIENVWGNKKRYKTRNKPFTGKESNDFKVLNNLINKVIYGIQEEKIYVGDKEISKVIRKLASFTSINNLGWNIFSAASNNIKANIDSALESTLSQTIGKKAYLEAHAEFIKNGPQIISETKSININNKLHKILLSHNVFDLKDHLRNINSDRSTRIILDGDFFMLPFEISEYQIKSVSAISVMKSYKVHNGNLITKRDIGKLNMDLSEFEKLPSYYDSLLKGDKSINEKEVFKVKDKIKYISNLVDGRMTSLERGKAYNNAIASLILQHRSWLVVGIDKRFKSKGYNFALGENEIGYYRAFGYMLKKMVEDRSNVLRFKLAVWNELSEEEKIGVKRTVADLAILAALVGVWALLQGLADDEDEWVLSSAAYLSSRVLLEHSSFMSPTELTALIKTPFAAADTLDKIQDLMLGVFHNRDVERGAYEGYSTIEKNAIKLIPVLRQIIELRDPKSKDKYIKANALQLFSLFDPTKE